ncbi:MAG: hypothetical protein JXB19_01295 [Bacteroidales bacterium]|nr:hypothetical protein [Bacteroidales bacterium]
MNIMRKNTFVLSAILIVAGIFPALSQERYRQFTADLNISFTNREIKKLENAAVLLEEADALLNRANLSYSELSELEIKERMSVRYEDVLKMLFNVSGTYKEALGEAYSVFRSRSDDFWKKMDKANHRAAGMDKARYYENVSGKNMNRSLIRHAQVLESDRYEYSLKILEDAVKLGRLAVRDASRTVQICTDYPVEYNYGWEDDKTLEEIIALMRDPNINEPPEDIFATVKQDHAVDSSWLKEIIFKVQIAAHTEPLSEEYLTKLYNGGMRIDLIYEENWYKYSIGRYRSYDEAEATRRECNVSKAFVIAYQEGKKIGTQEAIDIYEKKLGLKN